MTNLILFAIMLVVNRIKIKMKIYKQTETDVLKTFDLQYEDVQPEIIKVTVRSSATKNS